MNQKFGMMTEIGLNHRENDVINLVVDCYDGSDKTSDQLSAVFLWQDGWSFFFGSWSKSRWLRLVSRIKNNSLELVSTSAADGLIFFDIALRQSRDVCTDGLYRAVKPNRERRFNIIDLFISHALVLQGNGFFAQELHSIKMWFISPA